MRTCVLHVSCMCLACDLYVDAVHTFVTGWKREGNVIDGIPEFCHSLWATVEGTSHVDDVQDLGQAHLAQLLGAVTHQVLLVDDVIQVRLALLLLCLGLEGVTVRAHNHHGRPRGPGLDHKQTTIFSASHREY